MFDEEFIQTVRQRADIVTIISRYVKLSKKGNKYWGNCPFHQEKTPSFSVSPDKQLFYCFGCQAGGNVFTFVMKYDNISFVEAVAKLSEMVGVDLPEQHKSPQQRRLEQQRTLLYSINELARDFFHVCLTDWKGGAEAADYLAKRGITRETIDKFQLGFAPPGYDVLLNALMKKGISAEQLVAAGLVISNRPGNFYDRFRNRVIFPIFNQYKKVVGFGGRVLDDSLPKYLNSPETMVFNKRHILYGLQAARQAIIHHEQAIIVEGYMDAITAHQHGAEQVVASLGTALTAQQVSLLVPLTHNVIIAYDTDKAGQAATMRGMEVVSKMGFHIKVLRLPQGKDPDEYIRKEGIAAFELQIQQALSMVDYRIQQVLQHTDISNLEGKLTALGQLLPLLVKIDNEVELNAYVTDLAQKIGVDEAAVRTELKKMIYSSHRNENIGKNNRNRLHSIAVDLDVAIERELLRLVISTPALLEQLKQHLEVMDFRHTDHQQIIKVLYSFDNPQAITADSIMSMLQPETHDTMAQIMAYDQPYDDIDTTFRDCIKKIKLMRLDEKIKEQQARADRLLQSGDSAYKDVLRTIMQLTHEKTQLK